MEKKLTKLDKLKMILNILPVAECVTDEEEKILTDFIQHEIELLENKSATKKENSVAIAFQNAVLSVLTDEGVRASELLENDVLLDFASEHDFPLRIQRITSALKVLADADNPNAPAERFEVKKVAYFRLKQA